MEAGWLGSSARLLEPRASFRRVCAVALVAANLRAARRGRGTDATTRAAAAAAAASATTGAEWRGARRGGGRAGALGQPRAACARLVTPARAGRWSAERRRAQLRAINLSGAVAATMPGGEGVAGRLGGVGSGVAGMRRLPQPLARAR